jgi:DNA-binding IclR family transcriptional regulator
MDKIVTDKAKPVKTKDRTAGKKGKTDMVKSCARALDVIEYFTFTSRPARTAEISANLGIPNSSADEILRTLLGKGYLTFNSRSKHYAPSYKIVGTCRAIEQSFFGGGRVSEMLEKIRQETGATVYMTVQNDCWIESVAEIEGSWHGREYPADYYSRKLIEYDETGWRPATNFAGAILALQSNVDIMKVASRSQKMGLTPKNDAAMTSLIERVRHIRAQGYALCRRSDSVEVESIACPTRFPESNVPVAVGILGKNLLTDAEQTRKLATFVRNTIAQYQGQPTYSMN